MESPLILNRYRPLSELGEGGFGTVVLAWDTRIQRRVAIKRLQLPTDSRGIPQRPPGLSEARTAAMLNHPAIVTVFDFDTDYDEAFLVMEHVDGTSLAALLDSVNGPLTLDEAAAVIGSVAAALTFAHDNGVLHLDIKPENILITRDGRVKVADFGIAEISSLSGHGAAWGGTPGYMPMEQLEGREVTEQTDEWAMAALSFELLTGVNPYAEDSIASAIIALQTIEPRASDFVTGLPEQIEDVLYAALGLRPRDRYPDVGAFAEALLPLLGDEKLGRSLLAELTDELVEDEAAFEPGLGLLGLWDRLQGRLGSALIRVAAAAESGWLAWSGLAPLQLEQSSLIAAVALTAVAGLLAPSLGVGLGLTVLVAGLFVSGAWIAGLVTLAASAIWWWLFARRSPGAAVLPLAAPALALARLSLAQPLLTGFALTPLNAAVAGTLGGALAMLASAASADAVPYLNVWAPYSLDIWNTGLSAAGVRTLLTSVEPYVVLAAWPLAAAVMSFACRKATRLGALVGALFASAILFGAHLLADRLAATLGHPQGWVNEGLLVSLGASLILLVIVIVLGAPMRPEEDMSLDDYDRAEG